MDGSVPLGLEGKTRVVLSDIDRRLLENCLGRQPRSWEDFVDRFLGLVLHVINHTAQSRSIQLSAQDREDLSAEVFLALIDKDFAVLRKFRGDSSLATYLTVIARRVVVRELSKRTPMLGRVQPHAEAEEFDDPAPERIQDRDEVEQLMGQLNRPEADIVRMYHLEGKTYREISSLTGVPENSVGPTLSRARTKMRGARADSVH